MEKQRYEKLKDIRTRIAKGQPTTFAERNIIKMEDKRMKKKMKFNEMFEKVTKGNYHLMPYNGNITITGSINGSR